MKKDKLLMLCFVLLFSCSIICICIAFPGLNTLEASTLNESTTLTALMANQEALVKDLANLQGELAQTNSLLATYQNDLTSVQTDLTNVQSVLVSYYIEKLSDPTYTTITPNGYTWYTAAENLGILGKPAIPALIARLDTKDDYERSLVFYALLLASQADNVKVFAHDDYIETFLDFDASSHPEKKQLALDWWHKYQDQF